MGQGLDVDSLEAAAAAVGSSSRRKEEISKKREAEEAGAEGQPKVGVLGLRVIVAGCQGGFHTDLIIIDGIFIASPTVDEAGAGGQKKWGVLVCTRV